MVVVLPLIWALITGGDKTLIKKLILKLSI
jgi:hypothetical protein